jgi:GNAT superfamily N-acetyltransferase
MSNLSAKQFGAYTLRVDKTNDDHLIKAYKGQDGPVGVLKWDATTGETRDVQVEPEHQRKGLATAMWNHAKEVAPIRHSGTRTPEGDAWAKTVGGKLPENWLSACTACGDEGHVASDHQ